MQLVVEKIQWQHLITMSAAFSQIIWQCNKQETKYYTTQEPWTLTALRDPDRDVITSTVE